MMAYGCDPDDRGVAVAKRRQLGSTARLDAAPCAPYSPFMSRLLLRTLVNVISSTPRVFVSGCGKARFAGNSGAVAKQCNAAAAAHEQPNVEIILTRVLSP